MPGGPWLTQESENYPPDFNSYLAKTLVLHARARLLLIEQQASKSSVPSLAQVPCAKMGTQTFSKYVLVNPAKLDVQVCVGKAW